MSHGVNTRNNDTVFFSSYDDYIRKNTASGMIASLGLDSRYARNNSFESAEYTIVQNTTQTIAHGLGAEPDLVIGYWVCKVANNGFTVGEVVQMSTWSDGDGSDHIGATFSFNSTNVFVTIAAEGPPLIIGKNPRSHMYLNNPNWKFKIKAIRF
jgi:hypothetical protein